ncbi:hypothetical protein [Microbacterium pygmaeum]|uniref:N-acetyltransferase domain-containing protein n=1 Tax=Microbacterium pygmaeum TaxID=370764 RepID=A0A1G8DTC8_9MICO|nr:hypothetical protein [Microbacterium pygmaeum]SDH60821.1 hypothetical protein SAMN04489810_3440 [Microbacterium pygmaeum]
MSDASPRLAPVLEADVDAVAAFLHRELNSRVTVSSWAALLRPPWQAGTANRGFQLLEDDRVVGVYAAVYSEREIDGERRRFCNLAAFCVLEGHRAHSIRLLRAILGERCDVFTDLSPSGNVVAVNARLGFATLEGPTVLTPNLPWPAKRGVAISADPAALTATLRGADATIHRDHRDAAAARHLLVTDGDDYAYLVFRRDRRKRLPIFATPLYVGGSPALLRSAWPAVASHLLLRHGIAATLAEERILGFTPGFGRRLSSPRTKMFRSKTVPAAGIDYLYSELALLQW